MIRLLSLSACLLSLIFVVAASAQQLTPKPGFTEKRDRVLCGRLGWPKPSMHDRSRNETEACRSPVVLDGSAVVSLSHRRPMLLASDAVILRLFRRQRGQRLSIPMRPQRPEIWADEP